MKLLKEHSKYRIFIFILFSINILDSDIFFMQWYIYTLKYAGRNGIRDNRKNI